MASDQFDGLVKSAVAAVPPRWNPVIGSPVFDEKFKEAWHRLMLTWEDDQEPGAEESFARGDIVLDSRCGLVTYGVVIAVKGPCVYWIDGCRVCRDGRHHRCISDSRTTHKGRGRVRTTNLRKIGTEW